MKIFYKEKLKKFQTHISYNNGFTLSEILIVILIVGVIAGLALPRFRVSLEKTKAAEAVQILTTILKAQITYKLENGTYTTEPSLLDVEVTAATIQNFQNLQLFIPDPAPNNQIARLARKDITYRLNITEDGIIGCTDEDSSWANICSLLGY